MTTVDWSTLVPPSMTWNDIVHPAQQLGGILILAFGLLLVGSIALAMWQERQQNH